MALVLYDRVRETTAVTGTSDATLLGAVTGFQSFSVVGSGNTCYYTIADTAGNWEVGLGTYSSVGPTLARTTVYSSSSGGGKVSFPSGTKDVFLTYPAEKAVQYDASGNVTISGALTATADSSFTSTGALLVSKGTTGQQPGSPAAGMIRYNTTTNEFEGYSGSSPSWQSIGGGATISNDTSTASTLYPIFTTATTGKATNVYTSNAKYLYQPSTGELQASEMLASNGIFSNSATVATSYSIQSGYNAMSSGPVTVNSGITVTVPSGSVWTIV